MSGTDRFTAKYNPGALVLDQFEYDEVRLKSLNPKPNLDLKTFHIYRILSSYFSEFLHTKTCDWFIRYDPLQIPSGRNFAYTVVLLLLT